ncbi:MAG: SDR family oxidoreductase [Micromonosporaceae bacterium]|nr:SDR family oxidoreductase [Micromonosporaceae bacterium]
MPDLLDMTGKVVAVTGGARGVGDGIVETFLRAGATVEICGRTTPESLREVDGRTPHFSAADVREANQVQDWIAGIIARRGRLDVVVNNAGGTPYVPFAQGSPRFHQRVLELNLTGAMFVALAAYPHLRDSGSGCLINISSVSARRPSPGSAAYGAAKAGLESLTASLAVEWAPDVRVNAVRAGLVRTDGGAEHYGNAEQVAAVEQTIPMGVMATPRDIGNACLWLASPLASYVTGAVIPVDGGGERPAFLAHTPNA